MTPTVARLRPVWVGLAIVSLALAAVEFVALFWIIDSQQSVGVDLEYYRFVGQRWLDTGVFYTDRQLAGPYQVQTLVDNLYPPHTLYLFLPFLVLPSVLWWAIPLAFISAVVWWCRPAAWAWPILAAIVLFPKTPNQIIYGNTDMWITAWIAAGVRWGWPAVLVTMKPSLIPFAALGVRSRSWWIAAIILGIVSLPWLPLWLDYPMATLNSSANAGYSFSNLPFFVLPIVAWVGSARRAGMGFGPWFLRLARSRRD
ncbi:MAG: hypothetical protein ACSLFN_03665 [Candidatus Limnocylindrales bacterium]